MFELPLGKDNAEWYYQYAMDREVDLKNNPIGNFAINDFDAYIKATLVGLAQEYQPLLDRAIDWLQFAISRNEGMGPNLDKYINFRQKELHINLALAYWIRDRENCFSLWHKAIEFYQIDLLDNPDSDTDPLYDNSLYNEDIILCCLHAKSYKTGIEIYERAYGKKTPNIKRTKNEKTIEYAYCLYNEQGVYDKEELFLAAKKMLIHNINDGWLMSGKSLHVLSWLKILYWNEHESTEPLQIWLDFFKNNFNLEEHA